MSAQRFACGDTQTGKVKSGRQINAIWGFASICNGHSVFPQQVLIPMGGSKDSLAKRSRSLMAEIDEGQIGSYLGTVLLPFDTGRHRHRCRNIVGDQGIESIKVIQVD